MKYTLEERKYSFMKWLDKKSNDFSRSLVKHHQNNLKSDSWATRKLAEKRSGDRDMARASRRDKAKVFSMKLGSSKAA